MKNVKKLKSILIVISILVFMVVAYFISSTFFEPKAYNYMVKNFTAHKYGSSDIVIITIDDKSIERIRWPWKRELYCKIFNYLKDYSTVRAIGFDALVSTPDKDNPQSDAKFYSSIKNIDKLIVGFSPLVHSYESKQQGEIYDSQFLEKFAFPVKDQRFIKYGSAYQSLSKFPTPYINSVSKAGSVVTTPDFDGYLRTIEQLIMYKGNLYPSLALRMFLYTSHSNSLIVKDNKILIDNSLSLPAYSNYGGVFNKIKYYKLLQESEYSHKTYSAIDIMDSYDALKQGKNPLISPQAFEDKIVLVGANAKTLTIGLEDAKPTPMLDKHPGVDIQATNLDNILNNDFLISISPFWNFMIYITLILVTFLIVRYFSLFISLSVISSIVVSYLLISAICFRFNVVLSVITPITIQLLTMAFAYSYRFILEGQNKEKIKNAMGKYISNDVMRDVVKNIDDVKLGGKKANVTVLFADIRGFTSLSEGMSAEEVSKILNEYFSAVEPIISKYNGVINKFIGDAVMAIFGEPIQDKNHAINAVKCANEMLKAIVSLQIKWAEEGKPKIEIGIGINTGDAFVGNVGSEKRLEYTVIGDMVNLASRIESYNKVYKTLFLISATTYEKVRNIADVIKISEVSIRGKAKKLDIYEVLRLTD